MRNAISVSKYLSMSIESLSVSLLYTSKQHFQKKRRGTAISFQQLKISSLFASKFTDLESTVIRFNSSLNFLCIFLSFPILGGAYHSFSQAYHFLFYNILVHPMYLSKCPHFSYVDLINNAH